MRNSVARMNLNVKIIATHAGYSDHADGSSHQALEDIAIMRVIPNMNVVVPADVADVERSLRKVIVDFKGPVYYRVGRDYTPSITDNYDYEYEFGRAYVLEEGYDIAIISAGPVLLESLIAAKELKKLGVSTTVVNLINIKPIDEVLLESIARRCGRIITVEEHTIYGGIGSAVAEVVIQKYPVPMKFIGVVGYGRSAKNVKELWDYYGLRSEVIVKTVLELLKLDVDSDRT